MLMPRAGTSASVLSSVIFNLIVNGTIHFFVFFYVRILGLIIRKSLGLTYSPDALVDSTHLLFLLVGLVLLLLSSGVRAYLTEKKDLVLFILIVTGTTILLTVSFQEWQTYLEVDSMLVNVILNIVLLVFCGLDGFLICCTLVLQFSDE